MNETFYAFPKDRLEALAMLYVQNQNMGNKSPAEYFEMYQRAYEEIKQAHSDWKLNGGSI